MVLLQKQHACRLWEPSEKNKLKHASILGLISEIVIKGMIIGNKVKQTFDIGVVSVSDPGDPQPNRLVNFVPRVPAQMD